MLLGILQFNGFFLDETDVACELAHSELAADQQQGQRFVLDFHRFPTIFTAIFLDFN